MADIQQNTNKPQPSNWDLTTFDRFIVDEFNRRTSLRRNFSVDDTTNRDKSFYPTTPWVRVCSNAKLDGGIEGFVMGGLDTEGFDKAYGFGKYNGESIIGSSADGRLHKIPNPSFKNMPPPGITGIESELSGGDGKFRITTINWRCNSIEQLEYMTPYFLTAGPSISIEFGWSSNIDFSKLLPLKDINKLKEYIKESFKLSNLISSQNGNYDATIGLITGADYKIRTDGGFDCSTTVKIVGGLFAGMSSDQGPKIEKKQGESEPEAKSLKKFIEEDFEKLPTPKKKYLTDSPYNQIFYKRETGFWPEPKRGDFDYSEGRHWWLSFELFINIINEYAKIPTGKDKNDSFFEFDISKTLITASPNLKSTNGNIVLIPNPICPNFSIQDIRPKTIYVPPVGIEGSGTTVTYTDPKPKKESNLGQQTDIELRDANEILEQFAKKYSNEQFNILVERFNLNQIINGHLNDTSKRSFPIGATEEKNVREKKFKSGYLKHLYIHKNVVIAAVKENSTYKDIIKNVLEKINEACGKIWNFEIVPFDNNSSQKLTIIDKNYSNIVEIANEKIYNFEVNSIDSFLTGLEWSVKLTDRVTSDVLFGKAGGENYSNTTTLPIGITKNDRLFEIQKTDTSRTNDIDIKDNVDKIKEDNLKKINKRIEIDGSEFFYFTTEKGKFALVEPNTEFQRDLILSVKPENDIRRFNVQPGLKLEISLIGISGIRHLHIFTIKNLPKPYGNECIFQVDNVKHSISNGNWKTTISAVVRLDPRIKK